MLPLSNTYTKNRKIRRRFDVAIEFTPIGMIYSPFTDPGEMPIQPTGAKDVIGAIIVDEVYEAGLKDLEGFSHLILLYHFHRSRHFKLRVVPFLDDTPRGVFATRAPSRPNPIGLSVVQLERIDGLRLEIRNVDILDQTPLLDIKPFVPEFDAPAECRTGWLAKAAQKVASQKADQRFALAPEKDE